MASPFTVEEIFSDVTADSVRLPRRQRGNSPQGLAVTLIADYTVRTRAWLPSAAIAALLEEFGVTPGAAKTAVSRLARRGVLERGRRHGTSSYRLTDPVVAELSIGGATVATFATGPDLWDGLWTVVVFTMPVGEKSRRSALRAELRWRGFAPLYDGVWVSPHPLADDAHAALVEATPGAVTAFRARQVEFASDVTRDPIEAWDLVAIANEYETFLHRWEPLVPDVRAGDVTGAAAVRARTEVMDTYRRFPALDPLLPAAFMPADWPRARAREVFLAVYDGLAEPARDHVRSVVARFAYDPQPDLRAHTAAEMAVGATAFGHPGTPDPR
ncbi:MAG: PaaX family transcriptional regulator [Saccharothrix sp.]|nr:PaaX family transcriptional regulator [Saccharothrix sp.]